MKRFGLVGLCCIALHAPLQALFDITVEGGYLGGKTTTNMLSGSGTSVNFSGYTLKPGIHIGTRFQNIRIGIGPTLTFPFVKYESWPSTWISSEISVVRYGGEIQAIWELFNFFHPLVRFELGKDNIRETTSAYPVISSGPNAGTVVTSQVAEVKYSYGELYYAIGAGTQLKVSNTLSAFVFMGYTAGKSSQITLEAITVNGAPVSNPTSNVSSISYSAVMINLGFMLRF